MRTLIYPCLLGLLLLSRGLHESGFNRRDSAAVALPFDRFAPPAVAGRLLREEGIRLAIEYADQPDPDVARDAQAWIGR